MILQSKFRVLYVYRSPFSFYYTYTSCVSHYAGECQLASHGADWQVYEDICKDVEIQTTLPDVITSPPATVPTASFPIIVDCNLVPMQVCMEPLITAAWPLIEDVMMDLWDIASAQVPESATSSSSRGKRSIDDVLFPQSRHRRQVPASNSARRSRRGGSSRPSTTSTKAPTFNTITLTENVTHIDLPTLGQLQVHELEKIHWNDTCR